MELKSKITKNEVKTNIFIFYFEFKNFGRFKIDFLQIRKINQETINKKTEKHCNETFPQTSNKHKIENHVQKETRET